MKMEPPYTEFKELVGNIHELWAEEGKNRERVGELMQRVGLRNFLRGRRSGAAVPNGQNPPREPLRVLDERTSRKRPKPQYIKL